MYFCTDKHNFQRRDPPVLLAYICAGSLAAILVTYCEAFDASADRRDEFIGRIAGILLWFFSG